MVDYVYSLHVFTPEHEDEISFRAGERIEVLERDDAYSDGWWQVSPPSSPCPPPRRPRRRRRRARRLCLLIHRRPPDSLPRRPTRLLILG